MCLRGFRLDPALGQLSHSCSPPTIFYPPPLVPSSSTLHPPSPMQSPTFSRRSGQPSAGRPVLARTNSFQRQLVTSGPTPPSLVHSHYLEDPQSIFNGGAGWRHARNNQLTPPNEHDKLCLLDTVPMSSRSTSSSSAGSAVSETGQLVPASNRRPSGAATGAAGGSQRGAGGSGAGGGGATSDLSSSGTASRPPR